MDVLILSPTGYLDNANMIMVGGERQIVLGAGNLCSGPEDDFYHTDTQTTDDAAKN